MTLITLETYTSAAQVRRLYSKHAVDDRLEDVAEIQKVVRAGTPTGGTFTLTYGSETSNTIVYNADQYAFEVGLRTIFTLRRSKVVKTTGTSPNLTHLVQLVDITGDASALSASTASLTGGTPTITITELLAGNDDALDDAIIMACEELNKWCEKWYAPAQMARSNLVNQWATWLACYYLSGRHGDDPPKVFAREFERIEKQLLMILNGSLNIPGILKRRGGAPVWSNLTANPKYNWRVIRVQKGTSSKTPQTTRPQATDYEESYDAQS